MANDTSLAYSDYASIVNLYRESIDSMYNMTAGQIRGAKGALVENIVDAIVALAWYELDGEADRFKIRKQTRKITIEDSYVKNLTPESVRSHVQENRERYIYKIELDRAVEIDK